MDTTKPKNLVQMHLPLVTAPAIYRHDKSVFTMTTFLGNLTLANPELAYWLRVGATRAFPDDLDSREKAIGLTLGALQILENQATADTLVQRFA